MLKRIFLCSLCVLLMAACTPAARPQLVIEEHLLSGPPDISTDQLVSHFAQGDEAAILARTAGYKDYFGQWKEYNTRLLEPFGYALKFKPQPGSGSYQTVDIYRGNEIVARDAVLLHPVSVNASGTQFLGLVEMSDGSYTLTRDRFAVRPAPFEKQPYGYVGDQLLSVEVASGATGVPDR